MGGGMGGGMPGQMGGMGGGMGSGMGGGMPGQMGGMPTVNRTPGFRCNCKHSLTPPLAALSSAAACARRPEAAQSGAILLSLRHVHGLPVAVAPP